MCAKLGGEPWAIELPLKDTMVLGYDSYHDASGPNRSAGAVVSTINPNMTRFHSTCVVHEHGEEIHPKINECFSKALKA